MYNNDVDGNDVGYWVVEGQEEMERGKIYMRDAGCWVLVAFTLL